MSVTYLVWHQPPDNNCVWYLGPAGEADLAAAKVVKIDEGLYRAQVPPNRLFHIRDISLQGIMGKVEKFLRDRERVKNALGKPCGECPYVEVRRVCELDGRRRGGVKSD